MKQISLAVFLIFSLFGANTTQAADRLFTLVQIDGAEVEITNELVESIGLTQFSTKLVGGDENLHKVSGILIRDLFEHLNIKGSHFRAIALNNYEADVPVSDAYNYDVIFAIEINGKKLTVREKGPSWIIYPLKDNPKLQNGLYALRSVWQVDRVQLF